MDVDKIKLGQQYLVESLMDGEEEVVGIATGFENLSGDPDEKDDGEEFNNGEFSVLADYVHEIN